ncbi:MAG: ATP-dependent helicase, partial [Candidatus Gracilibacteria bacterium]|nr:ATP-dependent helicase [Candidatus Gracilibacteria bacterium]
IFTRYEAKCQERGVYDFADMIRYVEKVFATDADLRASYAERYQFIMLDEYQDTNNAQNRIVESIAEGDSPNILVVGDDDQSIYRFQGANLENMFHFSQKYTDTKFIVLTENYRSTQPILDLATESISHNEGRISRYLPTIDKTFHAHTPDTGTIDLTAPDSLEEEKCLILSRIRKFLDEGIVPEEIAIILRTNKEVEDWTRFLEANTIGVESRAKSNILDSDFIRLAISLISTVADPHADESGLIGLLRSGVFDLDKVDILRLNRTLYQLNYTRKNKLRMFDILCDNDTLDSVGLQNRTELEYFRDTILSLNQSLARESFHIFFKRVCEETGFLSYVEKN